MSTGRQPLPPLAHKEAIVFDDRPISFEWACPCDEANETSATAAPGDVMLCERCGRCWEVVVSLRLQRDYGAEERRNRGLPEAGGKGR